MSTVAKTVKRRQPKLSAKDFAAIAAVEGLKLSKASRKRFASMKARKLTSDQKRAEVIRAYAPRG